MGCSTENGPDEPSRFTGVRITRTVRLATVSATLIGAIVLVPFVQQSAQALTSSVSFDVRTSRDSLAPGGPSAGDPIDEWQYMINVDNTGDPYDDPADCEADSTGAFPTNWPDDCGWPSMQSFTAGAPIYTQGDSTDFAPGGLFAGGLDMPDGKYLISVIADGHKIAGAHFTIPMEGDGVQTLPVRLDPYPLELVTLRARVFDDRSTNGQIDLPPEQGITDMSGFTATITDNADEVVTDWYGNPICTQYESVGGQIVLDPDGEPTPVPGTGGKCVSDANGDIVIPNLGPARYAFTIAPPPGTDWVQTTTLEGGLDWDVWAMEGYTGYDTEFNVGGESVPWVLFGYVQPRESAPNTPLYYTDPGTLGTNSVRGVVAQYDAYTPGVGQPPVPGTIWGGFSGGKITGPIEEPYIAVLDLQDGDRAVYVGRGGVDGSFEITGLRDGEYQLTLWDKDLSTMLDLFQVSVSGGEVVDTGVLGLTGWFARYEGHVFYDYNENGRRDPGEPGVPNFDLTLRNRENNLIELGQAITTTTPSGEYEFAVAYPFTMWTVMEAYSDRYKTTGVTYQVSNQPEPTTVRGSGVDINVLPIIGQSARIDWGVRPYRSGENGGIVGTVFWDFTRNELDPRLAGAEDWAPGIAGLPISVYEAVKSGDTWVKGALIETIETEQWERPGPCTARDADGTPIPDQLVFPYDSGYCIEGPLTGIQVDPMESEGEFGAAVNGNYGFGVPAPGKYIVEVEIPNDPYGRPLYKVEDEASVNVFGGDVFTPQNTTGGPPSAGGDFDPSGNMTLGAIPVEDPNTQAPGAAAICVGAPHVVDVSGNPAFVDAGGSPFQGMTRPGCEAKLIEVLDQRSVAPGFTLYTDVPLPARMWGYTIDDLNVDTNPRRTTFGEKAAIRNSPTGVYDWSGRLITYVNSDPNGIWEVLLPSTTSANCPSPSGVCPNMYRFVGNDPGPPAAPFPNYNPAYRTIAANFQAWPGLTTVADTAPTQVGASILGPGATFQALAVCNADTSLPQVFRVDRPYVRVGNPARNRLLDVVITGNRFGATPGEVRLVDEDTNAVISSIPIDSWTDRRIEATVPNTNDAAFRGAYQLEVVTADGRRPINTVTLHVIAANNTANGYNPRLFEVGPGQQFATVQGAIDAALSAPDNRAKLVVVHPNDFGPANLDGAYYENVILPAAITIQGVGAGGDYLDGTAVHGSVLHGGNFWIAGVDPDDPTNFIEPAADAWYQRLNAIDWAGNQDIADGEVVYVIAGDGENTFTADRIGRLDGLKIMGGDQRDFPGNINQIGGGQTGNPAGNVTTQGGGVFLNGYARNFRITNNVIQNNGGAYGGAIRVGTPFAGDNENDDIVIARNRILANGGTQLAGAISIFNGADGYRISDNEICGNSSVEYGGGISHFGYSPNAEILRNKIVLNSSYDEGGGVTIAGELPADPSQLSPGAGPVVIRANDISSNLANDDGGGLRFLQAGDYPFEVYNNVISNNVSTHQGGGVALNDAPDVQLFNNTIAGNITTATAVTSDGLAAPAGISTTTHSQQLQSTLPPGAPTFSDPLMFNNVLRDNRAGTWAGTAGVLGIGKNGPGDINLWDVGNTASSGSPTISYSMVDSFLDLNDGGNNILAQDPLFVAPTTTNVDIYTWRTYQRYRSSAILSFDIDSDPIGDYHILDGSPAIDTGRTGPTKDIDNEDRPVGAGWDMGADERSGPAVFQPVTPELDSFERGTGNNANINVGLDPDWWSGNTGNSRIRIQDGPTAANPRVLRLWHAGNQTWTRDATLRDAQEAYVTFVTTPGPTSTSGVFLRATGLSDGDTLGNRSSYVEVAYTPFLHGVTVRTKSPGQHPVLRVTFETGFQSGDSLMARINVDGDLEVFRKPGTSDWVRLGVVELGVGANAWPAPGTDPGGRIGIRSTLVVDAGRLDNFGGGDVQ